jgi:pyruvate,water dikinase
MEKRIYWFAEIGKDDVAKVGGKGANLGEMTRAHFPVPPGFIVSASAYAEFLNYNKLVPPIRLLLSDVTGKDSKKLEEVSRKIKSKILAAKMPTVLELEIKKAYRKLSGVGDKFVAVRSSATAEDLPQASFAGQQATFLNQRGEAQVIEAVKKCYASLFEPRAIFYRIRQKIDHEKVKIAVPVQLMIQAEKSGVVFTSDPVSNDSSTIAIDAGFGLGEAVVSGAIVPDHYLVDKKNLKIKNKEINRQEFMIAKIRGHDQKVTLSPVRARQQKLSDKEILELSKIARRIESHYGFSQDIEFAIADEKIYVVQTRPVTTLGKKKKETLIAGTVLTRGAGASVGQASGCVRIIFSSKEIGKIKRGDVLVTKMTNPEFVPAMKNAVAIVTDAGGRTSHAAIVSRELGIPCVVGTGNATRVLRDGEIVTVDGERGVVYAGSVVAKKAEVAQKEKFYKIKTKIYVNLGEPRLAEKVARMNVDGIGLMRAEFIAANIGVHPRWAIEHNKSKWYSSQLAVGIARLAKAFYPRPVVYRTFDFKTNEYRDLKGGREFEPEETNPMIGYRGAFRYLREPEVLDLEIKAIKLVRQKFKNVWVMIPFVRTVSEFIQIKKRFEEAGLTRSKKFKLWIMVEVPSTVILIEDFINAGIDGVSIGSNDLTQLILGADRDNPLLAEAFDERDSAVMRAMERVVRLCKKHHISVSICGQAPSVFPEITKALVRAGITSVSVNPDMIEETRKIIKEAEKG